MKKYNLSQIMKAAWNFYRTFKRSTTPWTFSRCLKKAWAGAKDVVLTAAKLASNHFMALLGGCRLYVDKGVIACAGRMGWNVTGKTFPVKNTLHEMGFRWDCESRCWYTESDDIVAQLV